MQQTPQKSPRLLASQLTEQLKSSANHVQVGSTLGFHVVRFIRKLIQSDWGYQAWLLQQHAKVIRAFVTQCKKESEHSDFFKAHPKAVALEGAEIYSKSIEMLRQQSHDSLRPRVPEVDQLQEWLFENQERVIITKNKPSLLQRIIRWCNPFDDSGSYSRDCLSTIRNSGLALRSELLGVLKSYHLICEELWDVQSKEAILEQGFLLVELIDQMNKLVASAEDMVLRDDALQAGFDLSILLKISLGLSSERTMIAYLVAHPEAVQFAHTWDQAIESLRGDL